ncbi:MAG: hypothetical protein ACK4SU_02070 [Dictyoglomus sp.]
MGKFPRGNEVYKKTPAPLINLKELVAWFRIEKFSGVILGETGNILTEILIFDGIVPKAFTYKDSEILAEDDSSIEIFVNDFLARTSIISLFSLDREILRPVLIQYFSNPKIFNEELYLFIPDKLIEESKKEKTISQIFIDLSQDKIHFLFSNGRFLGYYSEKDGFIKENLDYLKDLFEKNEGFLSFYQVLEGEFEKLNIPSLKFSFIEDGITKLSEKLLEYVNFLLSYYNAHGMHIENMENLLEGLNLLNSSLVCLENKFVLKKEMVGSLEEVKEEIFSLLNRINKELSDLWGIKLVYQKYTEAYKKFIEDNKKDSTLIDILDKLSPEDMKF